MCRTLLYFDIKRTTIFRNTEHLVTPDFPDKYTFYTWELVGEPIKKKTK